MEEHLVVKRASTSKRRQGGNAAIEFALVMLVAIPLLFGTISIGIGLGRALQAVQVTRDAGHMYGLGVDFSSSGSQSILSTVAAGFNLSSTGDSVVIFSQVITLYAADCTNASVAPCTNVGKQVVVQRIVVGNSSVRSSGLATPTSSIIGSQGNIAARDYMQNASVVTTAFPSAISQADGDVAYVVEGFYSTPDLNFLTPFYSGSSTTGGMYVRTIF